MTLAGIAAGSTLPASEPSSDRPTAGAPSPRDLDLPHLRREVHRFDFEERTRQPYDFPIGWYRVGPPGEGPGGQTGRPGHPLFGRMVFSDEQPKSGRWSFLFELEGGSMTAALAPRSSPIIPGGDYLVTCWVRTEGLEHARSRVVARFHDQDGRPLRASERATHLLSTEGEWMQVAIEMPGDFVQAAFLVIELQLLQPAEYAMKDSQLGPRRSAPRRAPVLEDVSGRVTFDDVVIWHLPRIELSTGHPGEVVIAPARPRVDLVIRDLAADSVMVDVRMEDLEGREMVHERFHTEPGTTRFSIVPESLAFGWYRVSIRMHDGRQDLNRAVLDFAYVPPRQHVGHAAVRRVGVNVERDDAAEVEQSVSLIRLLAVPAAVIPMWEGFESIDAIHRENRVPQSAEGDQGVRTDGAHSALQRLFDTGCDVTFVLPRVPDALAAELAIEPEAVLEAFVRNARSEDGARRPDFNNSIDDDDDTAEDTQRRIFDRFVNEPLVVYGQRVSRWQVGLTRPADMFRRTDLPEACDSTWRTLARLVPGPRLMLPWSLEQPLDAHDLNLARTGWNIHWPYQMRSESILLLAEEIQRHHARALLTIETLPAESYDRRHRSIDAVMRALHAVRAGADVLLLEAPWRRSTELRRAVMPDSVLPAWLNVSQLLARRSFDGEVIIGRGLRCWLFDGPDGAMLVAWNESAPPELAFLRMPLRDGDNSQWQGAPAAGGGAAVERFDLHGNRDLIHMSNGLHSIPLSDEPVFIVGIDPNLVRFRQGLNIEPAYARSSPTQKEHALVIRNPWSMPVNGTVRFLEPESWIFAPRQSSFMVPSGGEIRLPFALTFGRTERSGLHTIILEFDMIVVEPMQLRIPAEFEIGLEDLDVQAAWRIVGNQESGIDDLVITASITNRAERSLALEAIILAPDFRRMRRPISRLEPGETIARSFHLPGGGTALRGQAVRLGVGEVDSLERLIIEIDIPGLAATATAAGN